MQDIKDEPGLRLQLVATGMHLSPEFGLTYREIEQDGFRIDRKVEMLTSSDTSVGIAKSMGLGLIGIADALNDLKPDLIVVLGDRFEIFTAAAAALVARIPVAHIHGGEATEGLIDEAIRHSITKMAQFHFVANEEYRRRVIQLGEPPDRVFLVGGIGIDNIKRLTLLGRTDLEAAIGFKLAKKNLLITFHPVTLETATAASQMEELLAALADLPDTQLIFTLPNADTDGRILIKMLQQFSERHKNAHVFSSLGQLRYLSLMALSDGVVGNSSSGLIEAPSFRKGTINIGERQRGRIKAESVIDVAPVRGDITAALQILNSAGFQEKLKTVTNPYGDGGASKLIVETLKSTALAGVVKKRFYNIDVPCV